MPRDNLVGLIETMIEGAGIPFSRAPNFIGSKDPDALKIPARKGGIRLTNENRCGTSFTLTRTPGVYPDRCSRKRRNLRQVESNERCCSSESQL
jgi:hypothetical protein